jgi:hypothetical protein
MQGKELTDFFGMAFDAFPGLRELVSSSPGTVKVWAKTLEPVSFIDAGRVLNRWITGELENPPIGFRRELFALDVRAVVARMRDDDYRRKVSQEKMETGRKPRGVNPTPAYDISRPFLEKVLDLNKQVMNGTLTDYEWDDGVKTLIDEAFTANG